MQNHKVSINNIGIPGILLVLVFIPFLYSIRTRFGIIPLIDSIIPNTVRKISNDEYFVGAWLTIILLHWLNLLLAFWSLKKQRIALSDIGYGLSRIQTLKTISALFIAGIALVIIRTNFNISLGKVFGYSTPFMFDTNGELFFWVFLSINAAFCEEITYRGFGISSLLSRNAPFVLAAVLPLVSWIAIHQIVDLPYFIILAFSGLLFTIYFLHRKDITLLIVLHSLFNLSLIVV